MEDSSAKDMESVRPSRGQRPPPDSEAPARAVPEKIGRYQLCFELASGGMASVYLARAGGVPGFEKLVALKRIHPHLADEKDYIEMFLDEARIASRITHPNVCSVFDFGEADGEYFIAMEYLVGEPLSRVHRRVVANADQRSSALLPARMAAVIAQACEGLHAAHELQDAEGESLHVVHRDVSTENLFVTYSGATQVVDFGIAHARQRVHHTEAGQVKGTFPYMAPEQMTAAVVDRRVDVWALGAVLWELLTLQRLFLRDTDVNTMYAVLSGEIRPPSDHRSDVPAELDEIVLKALQRSPDERWQSARQMGKALRRFLANQEELVGPAEIADWMAELFPNGESRKRQLMEIARTTNASVESDPPRRAQDKSGRRGVQIPPTSGRRMPAAPPLPASLLVMVIGVATVLTVVALDWLRQ
ncbi:MAG: serine/threonine protein kinase [Deltaproteobacteria bacterium]|nr:serine/threonine protein kinase [Deltaproteobacteria bacterium]MBW2189538.1 serine/threonine protein kinase [Deltaproteobacteria bacterium]RLB49264.1 MAG: serine/threonine protein kinase [Deltaproteobacteria bacterium]